MQHREALRGCVSSLILEKQLNYCYYKSRAKLRDGDGTYVRVVTVPRATGSGLG